jgi:hypothetical protein
MRRKIAVASLVLLIAFLAGSAAPGGLESLAPTALGRSPAGMEAMLALGGTGEALDHMCGVRDCADIRLFWYTDLEAAKAAARATGKPILSLRLMGRLDEELSCANSRFFRTVFYKNQEINELLRDRFVLHWRSVRPVPKVTIDFGDGSTLVQTLTGNSIHYVLDSRGRLLDALPGLYGPASFEKALREAERASHQAARLPDAEFIPWAIARTERQVKASQAAFARDSAALDSSTPGPRVLTGRTASKMASEAPLLQAFGDLNAGEISDLAALRRPRVHLDPDSRAFLLQKHGVTDPQEAERLVDAFESTVAQDELINEQLAGPAILRKLIATKERASFNLEAFNLEVYEEIFQTPLSDPWLGLAPKDVYTALPASRRIVAARPKR